MLAQQTTDLLHHLKLPAMAEALEEQRRLPAIGSLDFEDRLALLLEREQLARENRRLTRLFNSRDRDIRPPSKMSIFA